MSVPTKYDESIVERICEQLVEGKPLSEICRAEGMPDRVTVWRWGKADDEIGARLRDAWEVGFLCEGEKMYRAVVSMAFKNPHAAKAMLEAAKWHLGRRSATYADKPLFQGALVNVGDKDAFAAFGAALEEARAARASLAERTTRVVVSGPARAGDAAGGLADLASACRERIREDEDGG